MLIDRPQITESSSLSNATMASGVSDPLLPSIGELFFRTDLGSLRVYNGSVWSEAGSASLSTHAANDTIHLTSAQNTLLDGLNIPTLTAAEVNHLIGVTSPIQTQINNHLGDSTLHLSAFQNTLLDGLAATLTSTELNYVDGVTSAIQPQLNTLSAEKISRDGTIAMTGNLSLGGNKVVNVGYPTTASDAANKLYVDNLINGMHWFDPVRVSSTANINLGVGGLLTIDGVTLAVSDRVLVKDQTLPAQNGIYLAASGAWSRAPDYNTAELITTSAVFVISGTTQGKSTWVQNNLIVTLDTDPINFIPSSGPVINTAGSGIVLGVGGQVSIKEGAGIAFDGNNALIVDVHAAGGLMLTTNNTSAAVITTTTAQLALTESGVTAGTYNNSATAVSPFTVDSKGRLTGTGAAITITPAFASITSKPTTLAGYGITDAVLKAGDTMTGSLNFTNGTYLTGATPPTLTAYFSTAAYGIAQGDNRTSFGYNSAGVYQNYIRGAITTIDSTLVLNDALTGTSAQLSSLNVSAASAGEVRLTTGGAANSGYIAFFQPNHVTRAGYIGFATNGGNINYNNDVGPGHSFNGSITAAGDITAFSDRRLKEDITPIFDPLWKIQQLHGVTFTRIENGKSGTGLIAQDVLAVLPEAVQENENGMLSVAYGNMAGLLVEAIKALDEEVKFLRAEVKALKESK